MAAIDWPTLVSNGGKCLLQPMLLSTLNRIPEELLYRYVVLFYHELLT